MKKTFLINVIISALFLVLDPVLNWCSEWAYNYDVSGRMVMGVMTSVLLVLFAFVAACSVFYSGYKTFNKRDLKYLIPVLIFVAVAYIVFSDADSYWVKLINYYSVTPT